jgi:hypothetical protein
MNYESRLKKEDIAEPVKKWTRQNREALLRQVGAAFSLL